MGAAFVTGPEDSERLRRRQAKNWALAGLLAAVVVLIYVTFLIRAGGG